MNDDGALTGCSSRQTQSRRILIVDDNPTIHEDFRKILAGPGAGENELERATAELFNDAISSPPPDEFELVSTYQGEEALDMVRQAVQALRPFALAFVDVRMPPGLDGIETTTRLWQIDPNLHVVICTAYSDYSLDQLGSRLGASDRLLILKKPFDTVEVKQMAVALVEKWRLAQEARQRLEGLDSLVAQRTRELTLLNEKLLQDMTARKELEQQLRQAQKMEAIGQLARGVAHDFNNLLAVIRGNTELVLMETIRSTDQATECLNQVIAASDRAAKLTRQLLAFSRKQVMQCQPLNLNEVITNLSGMLARIIGEDIQLRFTYSANVPLVHADSGMIEQVILNLAVNARDAMRSGGQLNISTQAICLDSLSARNHSEARPGKFACFSVEDTGCGIPSKLLPHIFEPFFTTKEVGKGVGLGLATVYGIVKQHQGWVQVDSQLGLGTRFAIFMPGLEDVSPPTRSTPVETKAQGGSEIILLVEDEEAVRCSTKKLLQTFGYQVKEASSGREALGWTPTQLMQLDLLLTDVVMPDGITGLELAKRLRDQKPGLKVIFMSGYSGDRAGAGASLDLGSTEYFIQKPCPAREFLRVVRRCLDEQPLKPGSPPSQSPFEMEA